MADQDWLAPVIPLPARATPAAIDRDFLCRVLLAAAAALAQAGTAAAARHLLSGWDGPPVIRQAAAELLETLSGL
jgi:hypothetical protein